MEKREAWLTHGMKTRSRSGTRAWTIARPRKAVTDRSATSAARVRRSTRIRRAEQARSRSRCATPGGASRAPRTSLRRRGSGAAGRRSPATALRLSTRPRTPSRGADGLRKPGRAHSRRSRRPSLPGASGTACCRIVCTLSPVSCARATAGSSATPAASEAHRAARRSVASIIVVSLLGHLAERDREAFHELIVAISIDRSNSSSSVKCGFTASQTASGTWLLATSVSASVHSSAARSRSVKNGVSRHVTTVARRRSVSPPLRASVVCMSTQNAQPLICDARRRTSSASGFSIGSSRGIPRRCASP